MNLKRGILWLVAAGIAGWFMIEISPGLQAKVNEAIPTSKPWATKAKVYAVAGGLFALFAMALREVSRALRVKVVT